jgi:hypothetical protein
MGLVSALPRVAAGLVALGIVAGTAVDRSGPATGCWRPTSTPTPASATASLSPFDLVLQADRRGLDVLAITEHNITFPGFMGRWFARRVGGPTILVGEEVTTKHYHLHGVGLTERVNASLPLPEVLAAIHRQGGIAIAAHPVRQMQAAFIPELDHIDAAEVMHPIAFGRRNPSWRWEDMREFYERALASGHRLTAVASSDYHFFSPLGVCRTLVFARDDGEEAVMEALRSGRTVVRDLEGRAYGDPAMIEALAREPYTERTSDYGYHGSGLADRVTRAGAWLGLLGLVLFGLRRRA